MINSCSINTTEQHLFQNNDSNDNNNNLNITNNNNIQLSINNNIANNNTNK